MKLRNFLLCTIILAALALTVVPMNSATNDVKVEERVHIVDSTFFYNSTSILASPEYIFYGDVDVKKDSIKTMLINSVYNYIAEFAPSMAPKVANDMVEVSLDKDFNICFMLAQAQIETHFGRYGSGQTRKSIFGANGRFGSYRECIEKYVDLVQNKYLGPEKTEQHLLQNYVTVRGGYRYAGNKNYEPELKNVYNQILAKTDIKQLQNEFKQL